MKNQQAACVRRSWKMFTQKKGWIIQLLILTFAMLVPIIGLLGVTGYSLEWARCTAWGSDAVPRRRDVDVGKCIVSGARAALIRISYGIILWPVSHILSLLLSAAFSSDVVVRIVLSVYEVFVSVIALVAALNATIYQRISAGYDIKHIYSMISSNPKGLIGIFVCQAIYLYCLGFFIALYVLQIFGLMFFPIVTAVLSAFGILSLLFGGFMLLQIFFVLALIGSTIIPLIGTNALGLWMRQFDVASWGPPFSSANVFQNQDESFALPLPDEVRSSETSDASVPSASSASPVPPASSSSPASPASPVPPASSAPPSCPVPPASPPSPASSVSPASPPSPIPPQDDSALPEEAAQSQSASLSSDVSSAGDAQMEDATATSDEKGTGHDTEEDDKKVSN